MFTMKLRLTFFKMFFEILFVIFVFVLTRTLWLRLKYDLHKIPSPPSWPLLGHTPEYMQQGSKQFVKWFRKYHIALGYPKIFKVNIVTDTWVFILDPDCIRSVINHKTDPLPRHPSMRTFIAPVISIENSKNTLFVTSDMTYAKEIRKAYTNGLQMSQLRTCLPRLKNLIGRMIDIIEAKRKDGPIDFQKLCVDFTLDSIGVVALEANLGGLDGTRSIYKGIIDTGHIAREFFTNPFLGLYCTLFPNSNRAKGRARKIFKLKSEWDQLTNEILERRDPPEGETPLWFNLRNVIDPETNAKLPYEVLRTEIATVVAAGTDTTGHQLCWMLALLATHSEIAEKLADELKEHDLFGPNRREVTIEDLGTLPYLNAVIKEGFRIAYVLTSAPLRKMHKDMTLLGYRLPKGTVVVFPGNRAMNTKSDWGDPDVVRPERWMTGEDMSSKYFWTFQTGPRDCPGQKLAMFEIRLAIVELFSKYCFSSKKSFHELLESCVDGAVIECHGGLWLDVSPRFEN